MGTLSRHSRPELPTLSLTWHVNIQGTQHQWHSCKARKQGRAKQHYLFIIQWIHAAVCEQSVDRSNLLLLKFTNLQLAEHFNYNTLFYFLKSLLLLYSLSHLLCLIISLSLSLCSLCFVSLPHSLSLVLVQSVSLSHSVSLALICCLIYLTRLSLSLIHCQTILSQRVAGLCLMSSPCLEYQGCHPIPLSYHLSCFST